MISKTLPEATQKSPQELAIDAAIKNLRSQSGWWNGDPRARQVLTKLIEEVASFSPPAK